METDSIIHGHSPWEKSIHVHHGEQLKPGCKSNEVSGNSSSSSLTSSPTQRANTPPNTWKTIKPPNGSTRSGENSPLTPDSTIGISFGPGVPRTQTPPSLISKDVIQRDSTNSNVFPVKQAGFPQTTSIWGSLGSQWGGVSIWNEPSSAISPSKTRVSSTIDNIEGSSFGKFSSVADELDEPMPPYRQQRSFSIAIGEETSEFFGSMSRFRGSTSLEKQDIYQNRNGLLSTDEELTESQYANMLKPRTRSQSAFMFPVPHQSSYPQEKSSLPPGYEETDQISEMKNMWGNKGGMPEAAMYRRRSIANPIGFDNLWDNTPATYSSNIIPPHNGISYGPNLASERLDRAMHRRLSLAPSYPAQGLQGPTNSSHSLFGTSIEPDYTHLNHRRHSVAAPTLASLHSSVQPHSSRFLSEAMKSSNLGETHESGKSLHSNTVDERSDYYAHEERRQSRSFSEVGKGVPLHALPSQGPLYVVEFKANRTDVFYTVENCGFTIKKGDLVIVEADRGKGLGKVVNDTITPEQVQSIQAQQQSSDANNGEVRSGKEVQPKMIYRLAQPIEIALLATKDQDEAKAMLICQTKVRQKKLPMEVVDAEYQWDRRKLTFYFVAERRIDFRELVRDLFKIYKTRIWMCAVNPMATKVGKN